jgi:3-hydroxybutyrate dehydrogenase
MSVKNKVTLITGATSGLGLSMAKEFAKNGAKQYNVETLALEMNVTNQEQVNSVLAKVIEKFKRIDTVINNAGIQIISSITNFDILAWQKVFDIHMTGTFIVSQAAMKHMIGLKTGGRIIVIGSFHSVAASINKSAYIAAKHAQLGFVRALAKEGAKDNISSNLICPGFVLTPLVKKQIPQQAKQLNVSEDEIIKNIMLGSTVDGEFTTIQDVADTAIFLAGFKTNALTGQKILVSHGAGM